MDRGLGADAGRLVRQRSLRPADQIVSIAHRSGARLVTAGRDLAEGCTLAIVRRVIDWIAVAAVALSLSACAAELPAVETPPSRDIEVGAGTETLAAGKRRPPISADAPCSGPASVYVKLIDNPEVHMPDHLKVGVYQGRPNQRWRLRIAVYQGDSGSVESSTQRTNDQGKWTHRTHGASGYQRIDVAANTRSGRRCEISLAGRVARPQSG